jgi:hypothetical protein
MRRRTAQPACSHRSTRWRTVRSPSRPASRTTAGDSRPSTNASTSSRATYCSPTNRNAARSRAVASGPASHGSLRADRWAVKTSTTSLTTVRHSGKLLEDQPAILGLVRRNETAEGRAARTTCSALPIGIKLRESCPLPALPSPVNRSHVSANVRVLAAALIGASGSQPLTVLAVAGEPALALVKVLGALDPCAGRASLQFEPRRVTRPDTVLLHLRGPLGLHGPWRSRELPRGRFMRLARGRGGPRMSMALSTGRASTHRDVAAQASTSNAHRAGQTRRSGPGSPSWDYSQVASNRCEQRPCSGGFDSRPPPRTDTRTNRGRNREAMRAANACPSCSSSVSRWAQVDQQVVGHRAAHGRGRHRAGRKLCGWRPRPSRPTPWAPGPGRF